MAGHERPSAVRGTALAGLSLAGVLAATRGFATAAAPSWALVTGAAPSDPADVLVVLLAGTGTLISAWLGLGTVAAALAVLPGAAGRVADCAARHLAPLALRRCVAVLLGATLAAGAVPAAGATGNGPQACRPASSGPLVPGPDPGFHPLVAAPAGAGAVLDPPFTPAGPPPGPAGAQDLGPLGRLPRAGSTVEDSVVVRRGDTLWDISARHLGRSATAAEIAREWPRWYSANRAVIGAHPDLIQPGQRLSPPPGGGR